MRIIERFWSNHDHILPRHLDLDGIPYLLIPPMSELDMRFWEAVKQIRGK